ncbi:hypothetical protein VNI00_003289 [Paramarasmius palmivorus]|uniref:Uncharacterized protein n=1 Tax=Paramarasmius palmivorus TaxID=297713 RepID=A0AAW0DPE4_9AGAR
MSTNLTNLTANPTVPEYSDDLEWVTAYLVAHMMSEPSRRYVWILWLCIGSVFLFYTFLNLTGKRLGGHYTALWRRWAIQRRTWRGLIRRSGKKKPPALLPSNGQLITLIVLPIVTLLLAFGGPDYIAPDTFIFNLKPPKIHARGYDTSSYTQFQPQYQINKAWWTAGGRTGLIAFGLFPLVVLFALKAPPFAFFALPFTTQLHFDKLSVASQMVRPTSIPHVALTRRSVERPTG